MPAEFDFTDAERRVLPFLGEDRMNKEIAESLGASPEAIKSHVQRIMDKTGLHDRCELGPAIRRGALGCDSATH